MKFDVIQIPRQEALSELEKRRRDFQVSGKYPFFIGDERNLRGLQANAEIDAAEEADIIARTNDFDVEEWFRKHQIEESDWDDYDELWGEWFESAAEGLKPYVLREGFGQPQEFIYLGLAEIGESWMLPAVLGFGGWNDCPWADVHCALLKYWQENFGAEIITVGGDYIECTVKNPPATEETARKLAGQQYSYCPDIVSQGTQTVSHLGAGLLNSKLWFFWWD